MVVNPHRRHGSLDYFSPINYEKRHAERQAAERVNEPVDGVPSRSVNTAAPDPVLVTHRKGRIVLAAETARAA